MLFLLFTLACESDPGLVIQADVELAVARKDFSVLCAGMNMDDSDLRTYSTEQIRTFKDPKVSECICKSIKSPDVGWDSAVAAGLKDETRNEVARCFTSVIMDPKLPNREEAIVALSEVKAPIARTTIDKIARQKEAEPKV